MADYYLKSYARNGHDITILVNTNTGTIDSENTHTVIGLIDALHTLSLTADASTEKLTNASLDDKRVAALSIDGADKIYSDSFEKLLSEGALTLTNSDTFTAGEGVNVYYAEDADGDAVAGVRTNDLQDVIARVEAALNAEADGAADSQIDTWLFGLGFDKE